MTLGGGVPDVRLFPAEALARAIRRAMRRTPLDVLSYGDPAGPRALRRAIANMVDTMLRNVGGSCPARSR